jgi:hypothetical protein
MKLSRSSGKIFDYNAPIIFAGGQYYFTSPAGGDRALNDPQGHLIIRNTNPDGCPPPAEAKNPPDVSAQARRVLWTNWTDLFNHMNSNGINLLRIFLTGGTAMLNGTPTDSFPYNRSAGGKLSVRAAIDAYPQADRFNTTYFNNLRNFAIQANNHGIALQVCLFNYFDLANVSDLYYQGWSQSIWNPAATDDPTWGSANLVNTAGSDVNTHCAYFVNTANAGLMNVQRKLVSRIVDALRGCTNIIFEIMNEPRGTTSLSIARWYSQVAGWLLTAAGASWRPLISVNAAHGTDGAFDIDTWKNNSAQLPHYPDVDIVSYHGLTGMAARSEAVCGGYQNIAMVDRGSIINRASTHRSVHPDKALIYSTDALTHQMHYYNGPLTQQVFSMNKRDGQVSTALPNDVSTVDVDTQLKRSDLDNWAYWCLVLALKPQARQGNIHFQNISSFQTSFESINEAFLQALDDTGMTRPIVSRVAGQ